MGGALDNLKNGNTASTAGKVYVGPGKTKTIKMKKTGKELTIESSTASVVDLKSSYYTDLRLRAILWPGRLMAQVIGIRNLRVLVK